MIFIFGSSAPVLLLCRKLVAGSNKACKNVKVKAEVVVTECTGCCHNKLCLPRGTRLHGGFAVSCVHKIRTGEMGLALQQG